MINILTILFTVAFIFTSPLCIAEKIPVAQFLTTIERAPLTSSALGQMAGLPDYIRLKQPVAVGARGNMVFIFDAVTGTFYRYDTQLETFVGLQSASSSIQQNVSSITVSHDFSFYAADSYGRQVLHVGLDGTILRAITDNSNMVRPVATAIDLMNSRLLVADSTFDHIISFDANGHALFAFGERGGKPDQLRLIVDMAADTDGVVVLDLLNSNVKKYSYDGQFISSFKRGEVSNPTAIAVDLDKRVYISDGFDDTIKVYSHGNLVDTIGGTGSAKGRFNMVTDLYIDHNFLYVVDSLNGRIQVFGINPAPQIKMSTDPDDVH